MTAHPTTSWGRHAGGLLAIAALLVAGCAGSGASPAASASPLPPASVQAAPFTLTSTAFAPGGAIPKRFTCDGEDLSPALAWSGAPVSTGAFVLVVDDPDAAGFVHWIAYNLPAGTAGTLAEGVAADAAEPRQGTNDFGKVGWGGPCPPSGEHRYRFTLSALTAPLPMTGAPDVSTVRAALAKAVIVAAGTLDGRYSRP